MRHLPKKCNVEFLSLGFLATVLREAGASESDSKTISSRYISWSSLIIDNQEIYCQAGNACAFRRKDCKQYAHPAGSYRTRSQGKKKPRLFKRRGW